MSTPEERLRGLQLPTAWKWRPGPVTDWIDMVHILEDFDFGVRSQVIAAGLETIAAVHQNIADGAKKAAGIIAQARTARGKI